MRKCEQCGEQKMKLSEEEESKDVLMKWKRYDHVEVQDINGETQNKIALITKETPVNEMFKYFLKLLNDYTYHSFMAKWQKDQFDNLVTNLPLNHVICVHTHAIHKMKSNHNILTLLKFPYTSPFCIAMQISKLMERKTLKITPPSSNR